jgi:hypothetical protein
MKSHWIGCTRENGLGAIRVVREVHLEVAQTISDAPIYADADGIVDPELGEWRCPNGHDSSIPPKLPELMFKAAAITLPRLLGMSSALPVAFGTLHWRSIGVLIASLVVSKTQRTTVDTAERRWLI